MIPLIVTIIIIIISISIIFINFFSSSSILWKKDVSVKKRKEISM